MLNLGTLELEFQGKLLKRVARYLRNMMGLKTSRLGNAEESELEEVVDVYMFWI